MLKELYVNENSDVITKFTVSTYILNLYNNRLLALLRKTFLVAVDWVTLSMTKHNVSLLVWIEQVCYKALYKPKKFLR